MSAVNLANAYLSNLEKKAELKKKIEKADVEIELEDKKFFDELVEAYLKEEVDVIDPAGYVSVRGVDLSDDDVWTWVYWYVTRELSKLLLDMGFEAVGVPPSESIYDSGAIPLLAKYKGVWFNIYADEFKKYDDEWYAEILAIPVQKGGKMTVVAGVMGYREVFTEL